MRIRTTNTRSLEQRKLRQIRQYELKSEEDPFAIHISNMEEPVLIKRSVAGTWKNMWTPEILSTKIPFLTDVYRSKTEFFGPYFDTKRPMSNLPNIFNQNPYEVLEKMSTKEFFKHCLNPKAGVYLSYSGEISRFPQHLQDQIDPIDELLVLRPEKSSVNVWMGQANSTTPCHCKFLSAYI